MSRYHIARFVQIHSPTTLSGTTPLATGRKSVTVTVDNFIHGVGVSTNNNPPETQVKES